MEKNIHISSSPATIEKSRKEIFFVIAQLLRYRYIKSYKDLIFLALSLRIAKFALQVIRPPAEDSS